MIFMRLGSVSRGKEESRDGRSIGSSISLLTISEKRKYQPLEAEMKHDSVSFPKKI